MFVLIHYDVYTVDHLAVAVELKVARTIPYSLTQMLNVVYEHNQVCVYFILKLLKVPESYLLIPFQVILTIKT